MADDAPSVAELFTAHAPSLLAWLQGRTYSAQVAADICSETFAVAIEQKDAYDPRRGTYDAWLWGISRNLLRRYLRRSEVDRRACQRLGILSAEVAEDELDRIDERLDQRELARMLRLAVDDLSPKLSQAIQSRVLAGNPYRVVAAECGCSEQAARVRVSRGIAALLELARQYEGREVAREI